MTISFEISPEVETELREKMSQHDEEAVRHLLGGVALPVVTTLFANTSNPKSQFSNADFERLANAIASVVPAEQPPLSDYAVSRAAIYADHP